MAHSPHKRFKGCCLLCAAWIRGDGKARRLRISDLRRIGRRRRLNNRPTADERWRA